MATPGDNPASMVWRQPSATQRSYELAAGDQVLATLRFVKTMGTLAEVRVGDVLYSIKRVGFLHPKITIRKAPFEQDVGIVEMSWRGTGTVVMNSGRRYVLRSVSAWGGRWQVLDDTDQVLATVRMRRGFLRNEAEVTVEEGGSEERDLPLLLALMLYTVILIQQDSAAAAVAAT